MAGICGIHAAHEGEQRTNMHPTLTQQVTQATGPAPRKRRTSLVPALPSALAARGGVALVEFHLARRGFEFMQTAKDSKSGDIWAETPTGRLSIEVKTSRTGTGWFIKRAQQRSEMYCLVCLDDAQVFVLTATEIEAALLACIDAYQGIAVLKRDAMPTNCLEAWSKIGDGKKRRRPDHRVINHYTSTRVVRRKMANGETKIYTYPPTA